MKLATKGLLFMICLSLSINMNQQMGFNLRGISPVSPTQLTEQFNPESQVTSWGGWFTTVAIVGDIVSGLQMVWSTIDTFVMAFPYLITDLGAPSLIANSLNVLWRLIWAFFVWEFISGRMMTRD